ncbi:winged helix-turn-helix transcriptional regulator [Eubacterium oxidoreducens]|uniref:Transcriptional regulator, HxlR family n=1 Tax=Eubacterium oxidoreducens TaxID=1732 RepID=A0A1G6BFP4_EUBOX|nr:winged helix-turn-helix transcriptional regulator [Eubacterium oxidoreducens]SDB19408.1 transcriptional regulator, HxlR family [Eubacterium oxidoreducens]
MEPVNPYHFVTGCISGKWKMTILHHIHHYGKIRFNETKKTLHVSEKVLSQQLKELTHDGLVERIQYNTIPLKVEYILTPLGEDLIPALDILYIWSIRRMADLNMEIDLDAFKVHTEQKYEDQLMSIMDAYMEKQKLSRNE